MGVRTGADYLESLKDGRNIWIDGERVADVTTDPRFAGAAASMAELYDMQDEAGLRDVLTYESPTSGDRVGLSYIEPRNADDLARRRIMVKTWMDATCGMFGRSPDFMNIHLTSFASAAAEFATCGEQFGQNIRNFYEYCRENDICMTHTLLNPQVDRSRPVERQDKDLAARIVEETDAGIVIRGARMVATLAAFSHELMVMPSNNIPTTPEATPYAMGFAIPVATQGLEFISRPSMVPQNTGSPMDYPLSSRFDEQDAMVIFNDVLVPWDRVFIKGDPEFCNGLYARTGCMPQIMHQFCTKNLAKAEFMMSLLFAMVGTTKVDAHLQVKGMMSEVINDTEMIRACLRASEVDAVETPYGTVVPAAAPLWVVRMKFPGMFIRMCEIIQIVGAGGLVAIPSLAEFEGPQAANVETYFQAANADSRSRIKLFRLAADAAISAFSGRQQLYERYYSGDPVRIAGQQYDLFDKDPYIERIWSMLEDLEARQNTDGGSGPAFHPKGKTLS